MTDERLNALFEYYECWCASAAGLMHVDHAYCMKLVDLCKRALAPDMQTPARREKRMRWLGFVQGVLYAIGMFSVAELKNHSRPDYEAPVWDGAK